MVSASEARSALKEIIDDRKTLSQEISNLKTKLLEKMDEPSKKVKCIILFLRYIKFLTIILLNLRGQHIPCEFLFANYSIYACTR